MKKKGKKKTSRVINPTLPTMKKELTAEIAPGFGKDKPYLQHTPIDPLDPDKKAGVPSGVVPEADRASTPTPTTTPGSGVSEAEAEELALRRGLTRHLRRLVASEGVSEPDLEVAERFVAAACAQVAQSLTEYKSEGGMVNMAALTVMPADAVEEPAYRAWGDFNENELQLLDTRMMGLCLKKMLDNLAGAYDDNIMAKQIMGFNKDIVSFIRVWADFTINLSTIQGQNIVPNQTAKVKKLMESLQKPKPKDQGWSRPSPIASSALTDRSVAESQSVRSASSGQDVDVARQESGGGEPGIRRESDEEPDVKETIVCEVFDAILSDVSSTIKPR